MRALFPSAEDVTAEVRAAIGDVEVSVRRWWFSLEVTITPRAPSTYVGVFQIGWLAVLTGWRRHVRLHARGVAYIALVRHSFWWGDHRIDLLIDAHATGVEQAAEAVRQLRAGGIAATVDPDVPTRVVLPAPEPIEVTIEASVEAS